MAEFRKNRNRGTKEGGFRFSRGEPDIGSAHRRFRTKGPPSRFGARDAENRYGETGKSRADYQNYKVICDKCGIECEVPFKPTNSKPVYCSDCYKKNESPRGFDRKDTKNRANEPASSKLELDLINEKLNKIMKALKIE